MIDFETIKHREHFPLFTTLHNNPLRAIFDHGGFFMHPETLGHYQAILPAHHIYIAWDDMEQGVYIGKCAQALGRVKRGGYYHLGTLAREILHINNPNEQNHAGWREAWFNPDTLILGNPNTIDLYSKVNIGFLTVEEIAELIHPNPFPGLTLVESAIIRLNNELNLLNVHHN